MGKFTQLGHSILPVRKSIFFHCFRHQIRFDSGSGSKISTATLQSIKSSQLAQGYQMAATDDKNESARNGEQEAKTQANREGQSTEGQLNNTSVIVVGTTNGSAIRER
jgi:hypothetical protein